MSWSIINFTGEEIIKLALEMERAGKVFYEKSVSYADGAKLKEVLGYLAKEEEKHIADFGKLGEKLSKEFVFNESYVGEYGDYLKSMIHSHVFNLSNVEDLVKGIKTNREILQFALSFEKDSILIFQEFENFVSSVGKEIIKQLVNEEKGHIKKINILFQDHQMWQCQIQSCGYIYDPEKGCKKSKTPKGVPFEELPDDWKCPLCGASKKMFRPVQ